MPTSLGDGHDSNVKYFIFCKSDHCSGVGAKGLKYLVDQISSTGAYFIRITYTISSLPGKLIKAVEH